MKSQPKRLRRLDRVWVNRGQPTYFITLCTDQRKKVLANDAVHMPLQQFLRSFASELYRRQGAVDHGTAPHPETRPTTATSSPFAIRRRERRGELLSCLDELALEEPLEIRVEGQSVAVVMRTPGHDRELAAGFALTEGLVRDRSDIFEITSCLTSGSKTNNVVNIALTNPGRFDDAGFSRRLFTSSSCGICGKTTIEAALQQFPPIKSAPTIDTKVLLELPKKLSAAQETFQRTGGLHACALFNSTGELGLIREDVGRHNALDKLIGHHLLAQKLPLGDHILLLSGRISFEMTQKALAAGIAIIVAISAPTSLAVEFARANNQTLVGFLRGETMNIYAGEERVTR